MNFHIVPFSGSANAVLVLTDSQNANKVLLFHPKTLLRKRDLRLLGPVSLFLSFEMRG